MASAHQFSDDELALLAAIHANPRDDLPRLVYADWLDERGEPTHAEFIRLQCHKPYVAISNRDWQNPRQSHEYDFPWDDPTAKQRLDRLIELLPMVFRTGRYEVQRSLYYYEEHYRGLPLVHVGSEDDEAPDESLLTAIGRYSRLNLALRSDLDASWLNYPYMDRVDKLRIWADFPPDIEPDYDATLNSHNDAFWAAFIPVLAASPVVDQLDELNLCGVDSTGGERTTQSAANIRLCEELLAHRVYVHFDY